MDENEILNGTDTQNNGREKSNRNFQRIKTSIDNALDPEIGHDHDGFDSVKIIHESLENSGTTIHSQIDSVLDEFEVHVNDDDIHSSAENKESWDQMIDEVLTSRNSSSKGAFVSLDARLESMEGVSIPTTHDDATGRNQEATGSEAGQSRHLAKSLWDVTGSRTVQTAFNSLYLGGGSVGEAEDSQINAGQTSIDDGALQTFSIADRLSALYSSMAPTNEILNGTFNYLGFVPSWPGGEDALGNNDGTLLEHGYQQNTTYVPGWWVYTTSDSFESKCHIFCPSGYPAPPFPGYSPTQKEFNYWHGIGFFELMELMDGSSNYYFHSYPMPLVSGETYTLTWWYCSHENSSINSIYEMVVLCQNPLTGEVEDLESFEFALSDNLWHQKTVTFTAQTYNTNKRGLHSIHIRLKANQYSATFVISKLGLFRGDFSSNVHAIPDASYSSRMMEERIEYPYCSNQINVLPTVNQTFSNGLLFKKTVYLTSGVASTSSGEIELQIPPCYYVYNISACPDYFEVKNMNIDRALNAPSISSDDFGVVPFAGTIPDGSYFYVVSLVNDFGESAGSRTIPVDVSGGNNQAGIGIILDFPKGNATKIRIYKGTSSGDLGLLAEIDATETGFLDTGSTTPSGEKPKKVAEALLSPNDLWFSWEKANAGDMYATPITTVNVKVIPPKTGSGFVIFKVELWPAAMDWPTFGA